MMTSKGMVASMLTIAGAMALSMPAAAVDEAPLASAANSALTAVIEAAGIQTVAQSRAILIAPLTSEIEIARALLCVQLAGGDWSNPLLLTVEDAATESQTVDLSDENLVLLAMTETGVDALTDEDPALGDEFDLVVINLAGGMASIPRLSGFDLIAFVDGPEAGELVHSETTLFIIDPMSNASLYGDYFVVTDILGIPNQFAVFGMMMEPLEALQ